jgi:hypothetical protein
MRNARGGRYCWEIPIYFRRDKRGDCHKSRRSSLFQTSLRAASKADRIILESPGRGRSAPCPTSPWKAGRTSGCDLTVEVEHVLETPLQWPRHAATRIRILAKGFRGFQRASQSCSQRQRASAFEQTKPDGASTATIKMVFFSEIRFDRDQIKPRWPESPSPAA